MKILLAEDTRSVAVVMMARLTSFGHEVDWAENGQIALEKFSATPYDLVLMDIEMPVMNGFEATTRIRAFETTQKWAWTPIIFLTASDSAENLVTAIEAGGDDFMVKGLPEPVLHAKMKAMKRIAALRHSLSTANQKLEQLASRDGLTGLFNRRWMDSQVNVEWDGCTRDARPFALLMLDVDNFKRYNDHYGHQAGDDCLRAVASAIESVATGFNEKMQDARVFAARYGGEEFAVVLPDRSAAACEELAGEILDGIRALAIRHERNDDRGIVTASIGICKASRASGQVSRLFLDADTALYQAKASGRDGFRRAPAS